MERQSELKISGEIRPAIPEWIIWIQCSAFIVLYAVWILPEIVGIRNTALVVGALASLYPIYQYRDLLLKKSAFSIWCIFCIFIWAAIHLLFLSGDYESQLIELNRIWKYAAIASIFAFGLGLSLSNAKKQNNQMQNENTESLFAGLIYLGLCLPASIYLIKFLLTNFGLQLGITVPNYLKIYHNSQEYYVPKSDYVAFCLPVLAIALGHIKFLFENNTNLTSNYYSRISILFCSIFLVLFVFYFQNVKNGMAHAAILILIFMSTLFVNVYRKKYLFKLTIIIFGLLPIFAIFSNHVQKNNSWKNLIADIGIAWQTDQYDHWKFVGGKGYPINQLGNIVSVTNYERAAWMKIGSELSLENPWGYGLIEDSFKRMVKSKWPEASDNLSHSHSGWLDFILAFGFPGFFCLLGAMVSALRLSSDIAKPWKIMVLWGLLANLLLWITTEVSATVTFCALIFWISLSAGLVLKAKMKS